MRWFLRAVVVAVWTTAASAGDDAAPPVAQYEGKPASEWAAQLASDDVKLRQKAAYALWTLGPDAKEAALPLVRAIRDADAYVRTTVAKAVQRLDAAALKPVLGELTAELADERPDVRREAASLLWRLGPLAAEVVPELTKALASADGVVRANAAGCLANAGAAGRPALPAVERALGDADEDVRRWAAKALVAIDVAAAFSSERPEVRTAVFEKWSDPAQRGWTNAGVVALVIEGVEDPDENVRGWATHTLDTFAVFAGDSRPVEWIPIFRRVLEEERLPATRAAAAFGLGRYTDRAAEVVPPLLAAAGSREGEVKRGALLALAMLGDGARDALPAALAGLGDDDPETRGTSAFVLGKLGDSSEPVITSLVGALRDADSKVRNNAVSSLANLGRGMKRAAMALVDCLEDGSSRPYVREAAAHALADVGVPEVALPALSAAFEKDPAGSPNVARSLVALDAPLAAEALDRLIERVGVADDALQVLILLGQLGSRAATAVPAVSKVLDGSDTAVRIAAAGALARMGPAARDALPALERSARDSDASVATASKQAIEAIRSAPAPSK